MAKSISFKPKNVTKKLLTDLQDRAHDVIVSRYGLNEEERKTLENIGEKYNITRERVRQIENAAIILIRKSPSFKENATIFSELEEILSSMGNVVGEEELLNTLSKDKVTQNHIHFFLVLGDMFTKHKEDENFKSRWATKKDVAESVHTALKKVYTSLTDDELVGESEIITKFLDELKDLNEQYKDEEALRRWLSFSKMLACNPLGEWGKATSGNVKTRGIKDYAYLIMRKHGSPMHFREVAKAIEITFCKKTHTATCHNELIKDKRFVLVGRGMYALSEWGYKSGVVRDVIQDILKKKGPLPKEEVVDQVLKERYLKRNTILVNLQNAKYFKKNKNGLYSLAS
ncbi:MAG: hypothetical protein KBB88_00125 [Candidatus Pacebacteria bacterium]|nr:hypothetical protein [Candidatus Paceibacterota bacterium]